jgi:hypothetical protein
VNDPTLPMEAPVGRDEFCALCGADDETGSDLVSGFLSVPVVTPRQAVRVRLVCDACLSLVLSVSLQLLSNSNRLGARVIAVQDGTG